MGEIIIYGSQYGTTKMYAEVRAMIDTYNQKVNFVDFSSLESIISEIKK